MIICNILGIMIMWKRSGYCKKDIHKEMEILRTLKIVILVESLY